MKPYILAQHVFQLSVWMVFWNETEFVGVRARKRTFIDSLWIKPTVALNLSVLLLYMFRAAFPPIIRSS